MKRILNATMIALVIMALALTVQSRGTASASTVYRGVNLSSLEFGSGNIPGTYGVDYTTPTLSELDYFNSKGMSVIRLPFRWERVQPTLYGPLDPTNLGYLDSIVAGARTRGMKVMLDPHNSARYNLNGTEYVVGSSQVPRAAFDDFWKKMAAHYASEPAIYAYDLTNEPHDMGAYDWKTTAQEAVNAIRTIDMSHAISVEGNQWSGAWTWTTYNANLIISDPANNILYQAHQYFDADGSGGYVQGYDANGAYPNIGVDRLQPFLNWLHANNLKGFIGEYGIPDNDSRWLTVMDNFLTALDQQGMDAFYWAAGPWWGSYPLSIDPSKSNTPQMTVIQKHLSAGPVNTPTATPSPSPSSGTPTVAPTPIPPVPSVSFSATGLAKTGSITVGGAASLSLSVQAAAAANVLVDLEVYNSAGAKVFQNYYSNQSFASGETKTYSVSYTPPSADTYTMMAGVFSNDWSILYNWFDSVATFTATASAPMPTPAPPTPTPTSTPTPIPPTQTIGFSVTGLANPSSFALGKVTSLSLSVKAAAAANVLVDLEVYNGAGTKVFQKYHPNQTFAAGETKTYTASYSPQKAGTYTVKAGVFTNDWSYLYDWFNSVTAFTVSRR